ncbi:MAG TPA: MFS transporter [Prolixibacteraceae bacterium]|nr:MFS transporter [Prolixibacteraceae bacterium]
MSKLQIFRRYPSLFWIANIIELFERWAWYGFYTGFAIFLVNSADTGALGFTQPQKGMIMGTGSMLLYLLPIITGAIADKIGYKKVLFLSFLIYFTGFYMIISFESFEMVFLSFIWICIGGAWFKPIISAVVARTTDEETSSIGFGIFYMMVNIGGFIGPFIAGIVMGKSWNYVFYLSMAAIVLNFFITLAFFKEPIVKEAGSTLGRNILQAFRNIYITLTNWKYVLFLVIMVLFWTAFNQLYYSFPVFVEDWVNSSDLYNALHSIFPSFAEGIGTNQGTIPSITLVSMDAFFIIAFQLLVSAFVMRFRPLGAMMGGILVLAGGLGLMFSMNSGWMVLFGVLIFALGEMASSPKFTEYIGGIAPEDKKALYMGTSFLPIAASHTLAGWISGKPYEKMADKIYLLKEEVAKRGLSVPEISDQFSKNDYFREAARQMNLSESQLTDFLWVNYHPGQVWMLFASIAVLATVFLFLYDRFIVPKK